MLENLVLSDLVERVDDLIVLQEEERLTCARVSARVCRYLSVGQISWLCRKKRAI